DPDNRWIVRIKRDPSDRVRALVVENGSPRGSAIDRLPHAARRDSDVVLVVIFGIDRECDHTPRGHCRPDQAKWQATERIGVERAFLFFFRGRLGGLALWLLLRFLDRRLLFLVLGRRRLRQQRRGETADNGQDQQTPK